jgi:hypothetical protein
MEAAGRISKIKGYGADTNAGEKTYVILAPTPDVDSGTWLNRIKAEDARRKAVEAQLAGSGEALLAPRLQCVLDLTPSEGEPQA